jgi:hypothetical protein
MGDLLQTTDDEWTQRIKRADSLSPFRSSQKHLSSGRFASGTVEEEDEQAKEETFAIVCEFLIAAVMTRVNPLKVYSCVL